MKEIQKILIADDEPGMRILLEQTLEDFDDKGVKLLIATNGKDAVEYIKRERPLVVLLDVMMPEMNGFEVCKVVKKELGIEDIYILMLTAKGQEIDKQMGKEVGVDDYMTKPFNPDDIVEKVAGVLGIEI